MHVRVLTNYLFFHVFLLANVGDGSFLVDVRRQGFLIYARYQLFEFCIHPCTQT
jgi:hypothetical protein